MKTYESTIKNFSLKKEKTDFPKVKITTSGTAADFLRQFYGDDMEIFESFFLLLLNRQNITEGYVKISQGGTAGTVVDIKLIAKYAIESLANAVILCHNHPSGTLSPSNADKEITHKIVKGLKLLDIQVLDHVILTSEGFYSFADEGLLY